MKIKQRIIEILETETNYYYKGGMYKDADLYNDDIANKILEEIKKEDAGLRMIIEGQDMMINALKQTDKTEQDMKKEEKQKECKHRWNTPFLNSDEIECINCGKKIKFEKPKKLNQ